jgi:hypothetical protein
VRFLCSSYNISALEDAMWVPTQGEAIVMFCWSLKARYGTAASVVARNTAKRLQEEGDLEGQKIWNAVADAADRGVGWPQPPLLDRSRAA